MNHLFSYPGTGISELGPLLIGFASKHMSFKDDHLGALAVNHLSLGQAGFNDEHIPSGLDPNIPLLDLLLPEDNVSVMVRDPVETLLGYFELLQTLSKDRDIPGLEKPSQRSFHKFLTSDLGISRFLHFLENMVQLKKNVKISLCFWEDLKDAAKARALLPEIMGSSVSLSKMQFESLVAPKPLPRIKTPKSSSRIKTSRKSSSPKSSRGRKAPLPKPIVAEPVIKILTPTPMSIQLIKTAIKDKCVMPEYKDRYI